MQTFAPVSDPGTDFTEPEEEAVKLAARSLQKAGSAKLDELKDAAVLTEKCNDEART